MLNFLAGTNTMLTDIPTYSVLDFSRQILQLKENKSRESATRPPSWKFQVKFIDELESGAIDSSGLL